MKNYVRIDDNSFVVEIVPAAVWPFIVYGPNNPDGSQGPILHAIGDEMELVDRFPEEYYVNLVDVTGLDPQPELGMFYDKDAHTFGPYVPPPLTPEQVIAANQTRLAQTSQGTGYVGGPYIFACAVLPDDDDPITLKAKEWKAFYRALLLIDLTVEHQDWPVQPAF